MERTKAALDTPTNVHTVAVRDAKAAQQAAVNNNAYVLAKRCAPRIRELRNAIAERAVISAASIMNC